VYKGSIKAKSCGCNISASFSKAIGARIFRDAQGIDRVQKTIRHLDFHHGTATETLNRTNIVIENLVLQVNFTPARSTIHLHFLSSSTQIRHSFGRCHFFGLCPISFREYGQSMKWLFFQCLNVYRYYQKKQE
jgi:hypothetical protein